MLQEKLEEKNQEIQRLKAELQQESCMENGSTEAAANGKDNGEMIPAEDAN